jgi:hypothetical protein
LSGILVVEREEPEDGVGVVNKPGDAGGGGFESGLVVEDEAGESIRFGEFAGAVGGEYLPGGGDD